MHIQGIFPTPVGITDLDRQLTQEEKNYINSLYGRRTKFVSNYGTDKQDVLEDEQLSNLKSDIEKKLNEYFREVYRPSTDVSVYVTISWLNWTNQGESHHVHSHHNSFISGVYYVDTTEDDVINFYNSGTSQSNIDISADLYHEFNSRVFRLSTPKDKLIFFPSSLAHSVPTKLHQGTRCSLAFNSWIKGTLGNKTDSNYLKI